MISSIFYKLLDTKYKNYFNKIVFAIYTKNFKIFDPFLKLLELNKN